MRAVLVGIPLLAVPATPVVAGAPAFEPHDCPPAAAAAGARCGRVSVPEDHSRPGGRRIALRIIVLPASEPASDPRRAQYDLEGGPGFAVTDFLEFYAGEGARYRRDRDVVLADMRGTGDSNALRCPDIEELQRATPTAPMYPAELVSDCARRISQTSDPLQYDTVFAARDIDLVRAALGYEQLDLNAVSYGTTLALQYIADFPARVHSAAMMGTVPAERTPPRFHAQAAAAAFERLADDCDADRDCRGQFGDLRRNLAAAIEPARLPAGLTAPVFLEMLRSRLYSPFSRAQVPQALSRAATGDFRQFTSGGNGDRAFADGLYLSITCQESFASMDVASAIESSRDTLFGSYRLERQAEACRHWPRAERATRRTTAARSSIPVLFIAGDLDPVAPPEWAEETATRFPHSVVVRVPTGAHVLDGLSDLDTCLDAVIVRLFDSGTVRGLDTSCFARMRAPPFAGVH